METSNCAPHGLWQIKLGVALDEIKSWGFNTLRLPYANQCLNPGAQVTGVDFNQNPDLKGLTPLQVMDKVIAAARARGLRVILDQHRPDTGSQSALWYTQQYNEQRWISDWVMLAKRYKNNPAVIGADLHNEPHDPACWACGDPSRDWAAAATRAGNAVLAADSNWLIFVEGVQTQADGTSTWWGGGLADVAKHPIKLTIANHVVYSPHDYPSSVYAQSWFSAANYPANLPSVWDHDWGYLVRDNIAPVWLGEFGTKLETTSDKQWLTTLVSYLGHLKISFAYWAFNPNSGDTGGLVTDDWHTPQTAKLAALKPLLGSGALPPLPGGATPTPTPTSSSPTPTPTPTGAPGAAGHLTAHWSLSSSWQSGYVAQVSLTATGGAVNGWTISWPDPGALGVANSWGTHCAVVGGTTTCTGSDWAQSLAAGATTTVGLQMNTTGLAPGNPVVSIR
jgi:endoglucanase